MDGPSPWHDTVKALELLWEGATGLPSQVIMSEGTLQQQGQVGTAHRDALSEFAAAIDWDEPLIWWLLLMHLAVALLVVVSHLAEWHSLQTVLWMACLMAAYFSSSANEYAHDNWALLASRDWFGADGLFVMAFWGGPFLLNALLAVISFVRTSWTTLVSLKRMQLEARVRKQKPQ